MHVLLDLTYYPRVGLYSCASVIKDQAAESLKSEKILLHIIDLGNLGMV